MGRVAFSRFFSGDTLNVISKYCERIQRILESYDVVIFMARKAICFYKAMIINEELSPTGCIVISSRTLEYNNIDSIKNHKIAVVDDVVVRGASINRVAVLLKTANIEADYYVAACEKTFLDKFVELENVLDKSYVYYEKRYVFELAGLITQYIEASMVPFNIDYPNFNVEEDIEEFARKLSSLNAIDITSGLQREFCIKNIVLYLDYKSNNRVDSLPDKVFSNSILKIRFLINSDRIIAIPFVLLPQLSYREVEVLFSYITSQYTKTFCSMENDRLTYENMYKYISYLASIIFFDSFIMKHKLLASRLNEDDTYHFGSNSLRCFSELKNNAKKAEALICNVQIGKTSFSNFAFPYYISRAYDMISNTDPDKINYTDANGIRIGLQPAYKNDPLSRLVYTFEDLREWIAGFLEDAPREYVSSIIDVFVDKGIFVPSVIHKGDNLIKAYKLGEFSKLTVEEIRSFIRMLYSYQESIKRGLNKTEFEKICVLFFKKAIKSGQFKSQVEYEDDCYSICYSLYGPRVSTSNKLYKVSQDSSLISDFLHKKIVRKQKQGDRWYYYIPTDCKLNEHKRDYFCAATALLFSYLENVFRDYPYKPGTNPWNAYVSTYTQYLTLAAIGENYKDQILALCAEVYLVKDITEDIFSSVKATSSENEFSYILSGIRSGLWKYDCFVNNALAKTSEQIFKRNDKAAIILGELCDNGDENPALIKIREIFGSFLYSFAFFLNESIRALYDLSPFDLAENDEEKVGMYADSKNIFNIKSYFQNYASRRTSIEALIAEKKTTDNFQQWLKEELCRYQRKALFLVDLCDLYLSTNVPNYALRQDTIVMYSEQDELPLSVEGAKETIFPDISKNRTCKVFPHQDAKDASLLSAILHQTYEIASVDYFVFSADAWYEGAVQIENILNGSFIAKTIKKTIKRYLESPRTETKSLFLITKKDDVQNEMFRSDYVLKYEVSQRIDDGYFEHRYKIIKEESVKKEESVISEVININKNYGPVVGRNSNGGTCGAVMGNYTCYNGIDQEQFKLLISLILEAIQSAPERERKEINTEVTKLVEEVQREVPNKRKIKEILDVMSNVTSVAAFAISLTQILAPIIAG